MAVVRSMCYECTLCSYYLDPEISIYKICSTIFWANISIWSFLLSFSSLCLERFLANDVPAQCPRTIGLISV